MTTTVRLTEADHRALVDAMHVIEDRDLRNRVRLIAAKYEWANSPVRGRGIPLPTEDDLAEAQRQDDYTEQTEPEWA